MSDRASASLRANIAILVAAVLLALAVGEVSLRLLAPLRVRDRFRWIADGHTKARLLPLQEVYNIEGRPVRINRLGFRGPDWDWQPPPGTLRLAAFGGSSTFCYHVADDEHTWPAQLQRILEARLDMPVEVVNLGLPGYDTANSKINYLFSGRALHPHVGLVYHTWNDFKYFRLLDEGEAPPWPVLSGRPPGENTSALWRALRRLQLVQRLVTLRQRLHRREVENRYTSLESEGEHAHAPPSPRAWAWYEQNFGDIARFMRQDGALPVLIAQGSLVSAETIRQPQYRLAIAERCRRLGAGRQES